jgi:ferredoxin/flavodoxin
MAKNIIFYFTGTGNSLKVARDIGEGLSESELVSMGKPCKLQSTYETIGFVYPNYVGGLPVAVERFIKGLDVSANINSYYYAVCTAGSGSPGGLPKISKILKRKGAGLSYGGAVQCFSNYVVLYALTNDAVERPKVQNAQTRPIIIDIANRAIKSDFKKNSMDIFHSVFLKVLLKREKDFHVNENCNGCATCSKVCPVSNIDMKSDKPEFLHHCEQCMACIQWCPKQALNYKYKTQDRGRYHHPDIQVSDIMRK